MQRPTRRFAILLLTALLMFAWFDAVLAAGPGDADPDLYEPVVAEQRDTIYDETEGTLSRYRIEATFAPVSEGSLATIEGEIALLFVNSTEESLDQLYFRLYPNVVEYDTGLMSLDRVEHDGEPLPISLSELDTVATVDLPETLEPDAAIDLDLRFTTVIPTDPIGSYGMFSLDRATGSYALAHWLPLLAGWDPETGWVLGPVSVFGDPVFTDAALFDVSLTAPDDLVFVTTGSEIDSIPGSRGTVTHHYVSGPVRDFVMAGDGNFEVEQIQVGGTTVSSYFNPDSRDGGLAVLTAGAQALQVYSDLFGEYPYAEMDLVQIDLGNGAGGVEFPQLVFIGNDYYGMTAGSEPIPNFLEFVVAHEMAHQWWYGLVGNDQYAHAFMDEGLANYVTTIYFGEIYGSESESLQTDYNLKAAYFSVLFDDRDDIVDKPTDDFLSQRTYGSIVYGKGALAFGAIRDQIGDDAFFRALRDYVDEFRFKVATPDDLKAAFETASGKDLDELWRHWFEAAEGREDYDAADLANLLKEIGR